MLSEPENPVLEYISSTGQAMFFFGSRHTNEPQDPQFAHISELWTSFMNLPVSKRVVFAEGVSNYLAPDYIESIKRQGEVGAIYWLADKSRVHVTNPEPSDAEKRATLINEFDPHLVAYALIVQNLSGWFKHTRKSSFSDVLKNSVERESKYSDIYGFTPNLNWFDIQHENLFGSQSVEDKQFLDSISDPRKENTPINKIVSFATKMRNTKILQEIEGAWKSGKSIFIVYGKGHFSALAPELRTFLNIK